MNTPKETDIKKGHAIYTPIMLKLYNIWVLNISNRWIWRCPSAKQLEQFNKYISSNHLDIGVGTGYYLKFCKKPTNFSLSLMDLNPNCLNITQEILFKNNIHSTIYQADIFKTQSDLMEKFDSISINYLLHCLPGTLQIKEQCIANAISMLRSKGILFGATILADPQLQTTSSQFLNNFYNQKGIFSNREDTHDALFQALSNHLVDIDISIVGCVALFKGKKPSQSILC